MTWQTVFGSPCKILQAPMGPDIGDAKLCAAVSNAGGVGTLRQPPNDSDYEKLRHEIRKCRSMTSKPFGAQIIFKFKYEKCLGVILEEKVDFLLSYWGIPDKKMVDRAHAAGVKVVPQVGTLEEAIQCIKNGVDAMIVQGIEAGGHIRGQETLVALVPKVADYVKKSGTNTVIIAAGAIVNGHGLVAALGLGAHGVSVGTRFVVTEESNAHPEYKRLIVENNKHEYQNVYGRESWSNSAQGILSIGPYLKRLSPSLTEAGQPVIGSTIVWGNKMDITLYSELPPNQSTTGEFELMCLYAGQGVGLIREILTVKEVIDRITSEAEEILSQICKIKIKN